jgi:NADPH-ferrihemoprotein reductase
MGAMDILSDPSIMLGIGVGLVAVICGAIVWVSERKNEADGGGAEADSDAASEFPAGPLHIFFGSQTGTSEGFARILSEEGRQRGFDAKMEDLEDFEPNMMQSTKRAIFLMATYGEGEPTDNASKFYKWIKPADKDEMETAAEDNALFDMEFSVFGLGNSQYEHFNRMGKTTDAALERLGAERIVDYAQGDDDGNLEEDFENWKEAMWPVLVEKYAANVTPAGNVGSGAAEKVSLVFNVKPLADDDALKAARASPPRTNQQASSTKYFFNNALANVAVNRELRNIDSGKGKGKDKGKTREDIGSTRHIEIDLNGTDLQYDTADNLAVLPENDGGAVKTLCSLMGYDANEHFTIEPTAKDFKYPFPVPCTIKEALGSYFDLFGLPKHSLVSRLVPYVTSDKQKAWLTDLVAKHNHSEFKKYINGNGRSFFDLVTNELDSCKIPFVDLLHILPTIQPRYYTISSSSNVHPESVHITVSVTDYALPSGRRFRGLTSSFLQGLKAGKDACRVFVRASSFKLPKSISTPITMIGPGTGIAPMRALLQERGFQAAAASSNKKARGSNTLYFGCQRSDTDYIYQDELAAFSSDNGGVLDQLYVAFSREQKQKVYVQHLLTDGAAPGNLCRELDNGGYIFVCGATAMGGDVHTALLDILLKEKSMTKDRALAYLSDLQKNGRYVQELWST